MADSLKQHTHEERKRIVEALVPLIKRHMGDELLALAVTGSFARNADGAYSDIELVGFVKRRPDGDRWFTHFIYDGMLIDIWFLTRQTYLNIHKKDVNHEWPYAALSVLTPLLNAPFIQELSDTPVSATSEDCLRALRRFWPQVQEATGKVLTAVERNDINPLPFLYWRMVERMCVALSLLNVRPFSTRAAIFTEVRTFPHLPASFEAIMSPQDWTHEPAELGRRALATFEEMERLLYSHGFELCEQNLDSFVSAQSGWDRIRRHLGIDRVARKVMKIGKAFKLKLARGR